MADYSALHSAMKKYVVQVDTTGAVDNISKLASSVGSLKDRFSELAKEARQAQSAVSSVKGSITGGAGGGGGEAAGTRTSAAGGNAGKGSVGGRPANDQFRGRIGAGAFGGGLFSFAGLGVGGPAAVGIAAGTLALQAAIKTVQFTLERFDSMTSQLIGGFQTIAKYGMSAANALMEVSKSALQYQAEMETAVLMWTRPLANSLGLDIPGGGVTAQGLLRRVRQYSLMTPMTTEELVPGIGPLARTDRWARGGPEAIMDQLKILADLWAAMGGKVPLSRITQMMQRVATKNTVGRELLEFSKWGISQELLREKGVTWNAQNQVELEKMGGGDKELGRSLLIEAINQVIKERYGGSMFLQSATMRGIWSTVMENVQIGGAKLVEPLTGEAGQGGEAHNYLAAMVDKINELINSDGWTKLSEALTSILRIAGGLAIDLIGKLQAFLHSGAGQKAMQTIVGMFSHIAGIISSIAGQLSNGEIPNSIVTSLREMFLIFLDMAPALARSAIAGLAFKNMIEDLKDYMLKAIAWTIRYLSGLLWLFGPLRDRVSRFLPKEVFNPTFFAERKRMREQEIEGLEKLLPLVDTISKTANVKVGKGLGAWKPAPVEQTQYWRDLQAQASQELGRDAGTVFDETIDSMGDFSDSISDLTEQTETLSEAWNRLVEEWTGTKNKTWMPVVFEPMTSEQDFWNMANWIEQQWMGSANWEPDTLKRMKYYQELWANNKWYRVYGTGLPEGTVFPIKAVGNNKVAIPYRDIMGNSSELVITLETSPDAKYLVGRAKMKFVPHPALAGSY